MKKSLRKPENWQDFESLCKKLWGEIWEVPSKIKKNGRLGQAQSGVDIYAIPEGETEYWGIQCKGKDEYIHAKLTSDEIDCEVEKAATFKPKLKVFIIATTANKDATIEEHVRKKDLESRENGGFEILLFNWEDIVDLIEENRETFNFYVNQQNYKDTYVFQVYLNDFEKTKVIKPKCIRKIRRYKLREKRESLEVYLGGIPFDQWAERFPDQKGLLPSAFLPSFDNTNYALCGFEVIMVNEGHNVIEDWRVLVKVSSEFTYLTDVVGTGPLGFPDFNALKHKRTYCDKNVIGYSPLDDKPLVQKDNRYFKAWIEPLPKEYEITLTWELIARNFQTQGEVNLLVQPIYEDEFVYVEVDTQDQLKGDEVLSIRAKKNPRHEKQEDLDDLLS